MRPLRRASMFGITARLIRNVPFRLTSSTRSHASSGVSQTRRRSAPCGAAALLTSTSTRPKRPSASATKRSASAARLTSPSVVWTLRPSAWISPARLSRPFQPTRISSRPSSFSLRVPPVGMSVATVSAPARANASEIARPIPRTRPHPVIKTTLPSKSLTGLLLSRGRPPRPLGHGVDVADDFHDHRRVRAQGLLESGPDVVGALHPDPDAAHRLGHPGEADGVAEVPHLLRPAALLASVGGVEEVLLLIQGIVVVDQHDRVDPEARRGLELREVIVEAAVAAEADHRPIRQRALGAERRREAPAERAGAAHETLSRPGEPDHLTGPHAGVTGIRQHDAAFGQPVRDLLADALRPDGHHARVAQLVGFLAVLLHQALNAAEPLPPRPGRFGGRDELLQRHLRVAEQRRLQGIVASELLRIDVELD